MEPEIYLVILLEFVKQSLNRHQTPHVVFCINKQ